MSKNTNNKNQSGMIFYFDFPTNVGNDPLDNQKQFRRSSSLNTTSSSSKINTKSSNTTSSNITSSNTTSSKINTTSSNITSSNTTSSKRNPGGVYNSKTGQKLKNFGG